ncbi:DUF4270 domain-containing protein [Compostibacter hankyongensis]|uniref:DUF4270 domain-containing protein n=1 Tax=Compostibacter hankyongensis TaxID=1007089 RepID=A0ABP8FKQ9_9BACT
MNRTINFSQKQRAFRRLAAITAITAAAAYALSGCNESTILGQDLIPGIDNINTFQTDTFTVIAHTVYKPDSLLTSATPEMTVGAINGDPVFGTTTGIAYTQLGLSSSEFKFTGDNVSIDSAVLSFSFTGYYGDSLGPQQYTVYRINDPAFKLAENDSTLSRFYASQQFHIDQGNPLGNVTVTPKTLQDSVTIWNIKDAPQLRIPLSNAFAQELGQQSSEGAFYNDSAFQKFLNGFALVPDSATAGRKSLVYLDLSADVTGMTVFYHNSTDDSLTAFFPVGNTSATANYIHRNYSGTEAETAFNGPQPEGDKLLYLQERPGLYVDVQIPYLKQFPNAIINSAELIMTQANTANSQKEIYNAPNELFLFQYKGGDSLGFVVDAGAYQDFSTGGYAFSNLAGFGGFKGSTTVNGVQLTQYKLNISRFMQHLISDREGTPEVNFGFKLQIYNAAGLSYNHGRVVLGGGNNDEVPMKLKVIYTKLR